MAYFSFNHMISDPIFYLMVTRCIKSSNLKLDTLPYISIAVTDKPSKCDKKSTAFSTSAWLLRYFSSYFVLFVRCYQRLQTANSSKKQAMQQQSLTLAVRACRYMWRLSFHRKWGYLSGCFLCEVYSISTGDYFDTLADIHQ